MMLYFRRVVASICVVAPLFYIYWWKLTAPRHLNGFTSWAKKDVFNNTLGFSQIVVINLPSRTDRRDAMALAGAVSNLTFGWIDGVSGDEVPEHIMPLSDGQNGPLSPGARGSWRSHMNALQTIVHQNLGSALILEDDVDWDIRLKAQLYGFASASRTWLRESKMHKRQIELLELVPPSFVRKRTEESDKNTMELPIIESTHDEAQSVYGDDWDVLWLGHCGADFPPDGSSMSPLRVVISEDDTVPAPKHLKPHPFALLDKLGEVYPPHTRVVHAASGNVCSLAYAVSQQGARKLLRQFGESFDSQWDLMLQSWCQGGYAVRGDAQLKPEVDSDSDSEDNGEVIPICLTVQPPLISHHYTKGGVSDIQGQGGGYARGVGTPYIRLSVRENLRLLVTGALESELVDQLPDDGKTIW
ncbi:glycosyltransferase family 25 protein [Whalleya microplaca]|nr:glycosyltransferase family 25 protein [Whalleya microplaca]